MTRYLERADYTSSMLASQFEALEDRPVSEIDESWRLIFGALNRTPAAGMLEPNEDNDDFMLVDSYTLTDDLTFEDLNLDSITNCIANARENARQVRNVVGRQFWSILNTTHLNLKDVTIESIWNNQPRQFYLKVASDIRTLFGVMANTMYRDHGWHFARLGRFIERVQIVASLIQSQYAISSESGMDIDEWYTVLKICESNLSYRRIRSGERDADSIVDFLLSDERLSHSIEYSLLSIERSLDEVSEGRQHPAIVGIHERVDRMVALATGQIPADDPCSGDVSAKLSEILASTRQLNDDIDRAYFNYDIATEIGT